MATVAAEALSPAAVAAREEEAFPAAAAVRGRIAQLAWMEFLLPAATRLRHAY